MAIELQSSDPRNRVTAMRIARVRTGLTLRQFARLHGLSEPRLCKVERGLEYVPPKWRPVLVKALGLTEQDLCDSRGFPKLAD